MVLQPERWKHYLARRGDFTLCVVVDELGFLKCCSNCIYGGKGTMCTIVVSHYIYRSLEYMSVMLRHSGLFGLVCNSPVQGQVITTILYGWATTGLQTPCASASRLQANITAGLDGIHLSMLQRRRATAVADNEPATERASSTVQDV
ncbi:uncharacterized protein N7479_009461 [Penicillium vulpinum]|uniref:uncharacterized protein n=1 Tax=Penicillium vulpinum TaxID=29845 RepID=UPI0025472426|nr:uncharacterized protein N7479_009461 [Penicillium vulpinum]KAJ5951048.1 hypothetical protein N7479_009461 [Penicillium vulpinum]